MNKNNNYKNLQSFFKYLTLNFNFIIFCTRLNILKMEFTLRTEHYNFLKDFIKKIIIKENWFLANLLNIAT